MFGGSWLPLAVQMPRLNCEVNGSAVAAPVNVQPQVPTTVGYGIPGNEGIGEGTLVAGSPDVIAVIPVGKGDGTATDIVAASAALLFGGSDHWTKSFGAVRPCKTGVSGLMACEFCAQPSVNVCDCWLTGVELMLPQAEASNGNTARVNQTILRMEAPASAASRRPFLAGRR